MLFASRNVQVVGDLVLSPKMIKVDGAVKTRKKKRRLRRSAGENDAHQNIDVNHAYNELCEAIAELFPVAGQQRQVLFLLADVAALQQQ